MPKPKDPQALKCLRVFSLFSTEALELLASLAALWQHITHKRLTSAKYRCGVES